MVVEAPRVRRVGDRPPVGRHLPEVLAAVLQRGEMERPDRVGEEGRHPRLPDDSRILELDHAAGDGAVVEEPHPRHQPSEVLHIERPPQALADEDRVPGELGGQAAVGEDIGEVELPPRLQHPDDLLEDRPLVRGEVQDAVRDHHIDRVALDPRRAEVFQDALDEPDIGAGVAEALGVGLPEALPHLELLGGHVEADHGALLADELARDEDIPAGPAAEIEDGPPLELIRDRGPAAVGALDHLGVELLHQRADVQRDGIDGAACGCLQVRRGLQRPSVVLPHLLMGRRAVGEVGLHRLSSVQGFAPPGAQPGVRGEAARCSMEA
jgi:hypothetical protein